MDASPVLRQQSRNKIRTDFLRMKIDNNKMPVDPKPFKPVPPPHLPSKDTENQDPGSSETHRKAAVRPGVSRLPVLAKSLHLQTSSNYSLSQCRWEDKPLAGKAKTKKPYTRPVPFNMSQQHKSSRTATEKPKNVLKSRTLTDAVQPENTLCNVHVKTQNMNAKTSKHIDMLKRNRDSIKGSRKCHGEDSEKTSHQSGHSGPPRTLNNGLHQPPAHAAVSAEACLDNMKQLSLKDPAHANQTTQGNFSKVQSDKAQKFKPDHAALLSILRNEGVTPQSKPCVSFQPQRVSVMKSRQKAGATTGSMKAVAFSPDPAALWSILQNEGVKAAGPAGATPRSSVCPSGRGTSIYTAQRVPVRKNRTETTEVPMAVTFKETPSKKWTPRRVPNSRSQPMSSMKWHMSTQQSPHVYTPGRRQCNTNQPHQEEIVQRLFKDQVDEQDTNVVDNETPCRDNTESSTFNSDEDEEKEQRTEEGQPLFQRESVIFFSTGKKPVRAPFFGKQESAVHQEECGSVSSEQGEVTQVHEGMSSVSEATCQINRPVQSLLKDRTFQKNCAMNPAAALLRKRLPLLEEARLDEEVSFYTSVSCPAGPGFVPPRPRCGNPLASILHFEDSTRFFPIGFDVSSGPSSPNRSPLQESGIRTTATVLNMNIQGL